jgi:hypothetical protein
MKRLYCGTLLALLVTGLWAGTASAGGYVTTLYARNLYSGVAPGSVNLLQVKDFLDARGIDGTVSVVTGWPYEHERRVRFASQIYLSWDDLRYLRDEGWTITSHGRTGVKISGSNRDVAKSEVYGSLDDLLGRGFPDAWALFSYKGGSSDTYTQTLVHDAYAYGRGNAASNLTLPLAKPELARTRTTLGGPCNDTSASCYRSSGTYMVPSRFITWINNLTSNQWTILESFFFVEGSYSSSTVAWNCDGPVAEHWTRDAAGGRELYCWNDYQTIINGVSTTYASPATIARLYGRAIYG